MKLKSFQADMNPHSSIHNLSAHKNVLNKLLVGNLESAFKNRGFEFDDYRKYTSSDDAHRIDWKATLRANELLIKQTIEEKAVNVLFLIDVSDTMLFSSGSKLKCEYAAEIVCGLSFAIQREGNAIGIGLFNDKIVKQLYPKIGAQQYFDIMNMISNPKNYGGKCDLKNAIKYSLALLKVPSLMIIISDFINVGENWEKYLKIISLKYDLLGINIRDIRDRNLPKNAGYFVIENPYSNKKVTIDTVEYYEKYKKIVEKEEKYIENIFKKAKSSCLTLQTTFEYFKPIVEFLEKRTKIRK